MPEELNFSTFFALFYQFHLLSKVPPLFFIFQDPWKLCSAIQSHSLPVWIFFMMTHTLAAVSSSLSERVYPFLKLQHPLSLRLTTTPKYMGGQNFAEKLLSFLFLKHLRSCNLLLSGLQNGLLSSRNFFILGEFNCNHTLWDSKGTSAPRRTYSIGSSPLISFLSIILTPYSFS